MAKKKDIGGQKELCDQVHNTDLCTGCGACVNICPYTTIYKDRTVILDNCDKSEGRCYNFCPRTPTDLRALRELLYNQDDLTSELGAVKGFYIVRSADSRVRKSAQHGGTVSTLITLALEEGIIDSAILSETQAAYLPRGKVVQKASEVLKRAKSQFVVSPTVAVFNKTSKHGSDKLGIVATPCQALALAKMRLKAFPENESNIHKLHLTIGLFCGWALSWNALRRLLADQLDDNSFIKLDIPPSKYNSMEVHTKSGINKISLDEITPCIKSACHYCFDMTAEFSDLSVGSARLPEGWEKAKSWNQIIIRTAIGKELIELAKKGRVLEFRSVPEGNFDKLKQAAMEKKKRAVVNLIEKSGSNRDLIYLDCKDPVLSTFLD